MSTEVMAPSTTPVKAQKSHKSKDSSKKSSSKKRRHEEEAAAAADQPQSQEQTDADLANSQLLQETSQAQSPSKRQRTSLSSDIQMTTANNTYAPTTSDLVSHSPFLQTTTSFYVPLSPICHSFPLPGLVAEHLSPLLLTYHPPLRGVILSYTNARLSSTPSSAPASSTAPEAEEAVLAKSINEYAASFIWLTADFTILRPQWGCVVEGQVTVVNEGYLGLVCWNFFNAGIERRRLPSDWSWVGSGHSSGREDSGKGDWMRGGKAGGDAQQGHFVDGEGKKVEGVIRFRVRDFESAPSTERERGFMSIEGTLLGEEEDKAVDVEVNKSKGRGKGKRVGGRKNGVHPES